MAKHGKKYIEAAKLIDVNKRYSVDEACALVGKTTAVTKKKFDETVDVAIKLGVDPKHADQMVRGAVVLPHGIGKAVRVAVFAKGDKAREAVEAGADTVGAEDLAAKVQEGWMEFDVAIATPDMMGVVGRLGKVLGVFSRPDRDVRFHAVTVLVACEVEGVGKPKNPLEIREARLFRLEDVPRPLAMGMDDFLDIALANADAILE